MSPLTLLLVVATLPIVAILALRRRRMGAVLASVAGTALGAFMVGLALASPGEHPLARIAVVGIGVVSFVAFGGSHTYYRHKVAEGEYSQTDVSLIGAASIAFAVLLGAASLADNIVVAWMLIEGTTILGVYLIAVGRHAHSVEAAWKFAVLCFTGVGFGLAGLGVLGAAAKAAHLPAPTTFAALASAAPHLAPLTVAAGLGLVFIGFGTKGGIFPFHWWLPDAHSQTPTPVSSLMSGALVPTALVLLARTMLALPVAAATLRPVLIAAGLLGLLLAILSIANQRDAKRLLAYSTVEHMALMTLALAIGNRAAMLAFAVHLLGHAVAKGSAFMGVGGLVEAAGSREIDRMAGSLSRAPLCSMLVVGSGASLVGFPIGPIFVSEVLLVVAAAQAGLVWLAALVAVLLVVAAAVFSERMLKMLMGAGHTAGTTLGVSFAAAPLLATVMGTALLVWRPTVVVDVVSAAAALVRGGGF